MHFYTFEETSETQEPHVVCQTTFNSTKVSQKGLQRENNEIEPLKYNKRDRQ